MGRPLPGYRVALLDPDGREGDDGEIVVELDPPPVGLMAGYLDTSMPGRRPNGRRYYRTSDVASRDDDGYYWYVGRADDVFKSSDYRISPFELESALHRARGGRRGGRGAEPRRAAAVGAEGLRRAESRLPADRGNGALDLRLLRERLAPYKRVRRLEFCELPKTISGKIRRVQLRRQNTSRGGRRRPPSSGRTTSRLWP